MPRLQRSLSQSYTQEEIMKQCKKCPWRVDVDPHDIPNGYCEEKHRALKNTIAEPGVLHARPIRMMACHDSPVGGERPCVGWLHNQIGPGNNIPLRLYLRNHPELCKYELEGEQHETFEDTLP